MLPPVSAAPSSYRTGRSFFRFLPFGYFFEGDCRVRISLKRRKSHSSGPSSGRSLTSAPHRPGIAPLAMRQATISALFMQHARPISSILVISTIEAAWSDFGHSRILLFLRVTVRFPISMSLFTGPSKLYLPVLMHPSDSKMLPFAFHVPLNSWNYCVVQENVFVGIASLSSLICPHPRLNFDQRPASAR